jgi:hypothetical protein
VREVKGVVHVENKKMLEMARQFGFAFRDVEGDAALREIVWRPAHMEAKPSVNATGAVSTLGSN